MNVIKLTEEIKQYILDYWRPNDDSCFIVSENNCEVYAILKNWFDNNRDYKIDIGPFIGIKPYSYGIVDYEDEIDKNRTEFVFIYDSIDNNKLERQHLTF